jgi:hypothetical protein
VVGLALPTGCVSYHPHPLPPAELAGKARIGTNGLIRVSVAVLDRRETKEVFGVSLYRHHIQPVWLKVENREDAPYLLLLNETDPYYYSPLEAAYLGHFTASQWVPSLGVFSILFIPLLVPGAIESCNARDANRAMDQFFLDQGLSSLLIAPGATAQGFVFTRREEGTKEVTVALLGPTGERRLGLAVPVPGIRADYERRHFDMIYPTGGVVDLDPAQLERYLESLPRCATDQGRTREGDPLNLVLIGEWEDILSAFAQAGWDETESMYLRSAWRTTKAVLFGTEYRESPVSPLYVFGRSQDAAFQKVRARVNQRHHFRLWLTPTRFAGKPVWVGQASRDIGVRFSPRSWNLTTHRIDPQVDDERDYVTATLLQAQRIAQFGVVGGVGAVDRSKPRYNLNRDSYFTDGLRAVAAVSKQPARPAFFTWQPTLTLPSVKPADIEPDPIPPAP